MSTFQGSTAGFHVDKRFTTLDITSTRECGDTFGAGDYKTAALIVRGGAFIKKTACVGQLDVAGDALVQGNLVVLGEIISTASECLIVENQNICLGNVVGGVPTDITANAGGILIKSLPGQTKSWLWLNDIGPVGAWNSNQDINLGIGRLTSTSNVAPCPDCGLDTSLRGVAYRIDGLPVLTIDELGNTVVHSSLESVAILQRGAIDNFSLIVSTTVGNPTCITTAVNHGLVTGDQVIITGSNTVPSIDGCHMITVTGVNTFCIPVLTAVSGTAGFVNGPNFPIYIGTSQLWSGTHTINCGNDLIVQNGNGSDVFNMNGTTEQLQLTNTTSPNFTQCISTNYPGNFVSPQRSLWVKNVSNGTTIPSTSVATDIQQQYAGTSTVFPDIENTYQSIGQRVTMSVLPQFPTAKISSRAIDVTSKSAANAGSNVGVYAEAGGPPALLHSAGVMGITNANGGVFSTGVLGCANVNRSDIANEINSKIIMGGATIGGFFCNPLAGPTDWALYAEGRTNIDGDLFVTGNVHAEFVNIQGNCISSSDMMSFVCASADYSIMMEGNTNLQGTLYVSDDVHLQASLNVMGTSHFANIFADKIVANSLCVINDTELFGNVHIHQNLTINGTTTLDGDVIIDGNVSVTGEIIATDVTVSDKLTTNRLCVMLDSELFGNVHIHQDLIVDGQTLFNGNVVVTDTLTTDSLIVIHDTDIFGNLLVNGTTTLNGEVVINANVDINGKLMVDELCVFGDTHLFGNLIVDGDTVLNGGLVLNSDVTINANLNVTGKLTVTELCVTDDTHLFGNLIVDGDVLIVGDEHLQGNLIVDGPSSFNANVDINGKLMVNELCVFGDTHLFGNLIVDGGATFGIVTADKIMASGNMITIACTDIYTNDVQTIGATTATITTIPVASNKVAMFEAKLVVTNAALATNAKAFNHMQAFYNNAGVLASMGPATEPDSWASGAGTGSWKCDYIISGTNIIVQATGQIAKTLDWRACVHVISL